MKIAQFAVAFTFAVLSSALHAPFLLCAKAALVEPMPKDDLVTVLAGRKFPIGSAICCYQANGKDGSSSQWARFEDEHMPQKRHSGRSIGLWERTDDLIACLQKMNMTTFRFSLDWSRIEPRVGEFDKGAMDHYVDMCNRLLEAGIKPRICMYHWTHSTEFEDRGGFEDPKNIPIFARYCKYVAERLPTGVESVETINEVAIYPFLGWILGHGPPGKAMRFARAARVMRNLFNAHNAAYDAIKSVSPRRKVSFTHQRLRFQAGSHLTKPVCRYLSMAVNDLVMRVLGDQEARMQVPFIANVRVNPEMPLKYDELGVQVYTVPLIGLKGSVAHRGGHMTQMQFREYPQAVLLALREFHRVCPGVPLNVTEVGIATNNPDQRARFYRGMFSAMARAINEGIKLQSAYVWSILDNFEWVEGMNRMQFGLFNCAGPDQPYVQKGGSEVVSNMAQKVS